jgi:hypothetical protein
MISDRRQNPSHGRLVREAWQNYFSIADNTGITLNDCIGLLSSTENGSYAKPDFAGTDSLRRSRALAKKILVSLSMSYNFASYNFAI